MDDNKHPARDASLGSTMYYPTNSMHSAWFCVLKGHKTKRNANKRGWVDCFATERCIPIGMQNGGTVAIAPYGLCSIKLFISCWEASPDSKHWPLFSPYL